MDILTRRRKLSLILRSKTERRKQNDVLNKCEHVKAFFLRTKTLAVVVLKIFVLHCSAELLIFCPPTKGCLDELAFSDELLNELELNLS